MPKNATDYIDEAIASTRFAMILSAVFALILIVIMVYLAYERSKMDDTVNIMNDGDAEGNHTLPQDSPNTVLHIYKEGYVKIAAYLAIAVFIAQAAYLASFVFAQKDQTLQTVIFVLLVGVLGFIAVRSICSSVNLTETNATIHPTFLHESIRSIEINCTVGAFVCVAIVISFKVIGMMMVAKKEKLLDGPEVSGSVPAGHIDFRSLDMLRARCATVRQTETPPAPVAESSTA
jgi:uncharacterized membrane protein YfcA